MLSKTLLKELKNILVEEYNLELNDFELEKFALRLIGYFELLRNLSVKKDIYVNQKELSLRNKNE
jgi:hypothetical protein